VECGVEEGGPTADHNLLLVHSVDNSPRPPPKNVESHHFKNRTKYKVSHTLNSTSSTTNSIGLKGEQSEWK
jgi:hypothetical protein